MSEKIIIKKVNEVNVKVYAEPSTAHELSDYFTFSIPGARFHPKVRAKIWDGKIRLYNVLTKELYFGLTALVEDFAKERDYEVEYEFDNSADNFSLIEAKDFAESLDIPYEVRDYQLDAFVHAVRNRRGILLSPTASGKSLIIYLLLRYYNARTLIIVPTVSLVHQLASDFGSYGYNETDQILKITAGVDKSKDANVVISTWQSIYKLPASFYESFDVVIGDEAHLFKATSLVSIMTKLTDCKYRFGLTGTLDGTLTNKLVLEGLFGKVKKVITTSELIEQKHISNLFIKSLVLTYPEQTCKDVKKYTYQEEIDFIVRNEARNKFIKNLALSLKGNTLILYQFVEKHGDELHRLLKDCGRKVFYVHGGVDGEERNDIRAIVEKETDAIIIASYGTMSTGTNIRNLHNLIFASPSKSIVRILQSIGRALRKADNKETATLFDIADNLSHKTHINYTLEHYKERIRIYSSEGFDYKIYKVNLK